MNKKIALPFILFLTAISIVNGQNAHSNKVDSFYTTTRNNAWSVSKYVSAASQSDKKSLFDNVTFRFNQKDSTRFLIEIAGGNKMGQWAKQANNTVLISLPPDLDEEGNYVSNSYNELAKLFSWPLQKVSMKSNVIKFRMIDPMRGEAIIEFSKK